MLIYEVLVGNRIEIYGINGQIVGVIVCGVVAKRIEAPVIQSPPKLRIRISWMVDFDGWFDAERIVINLQTLYGEFAGERPNFDRIKLFGMMARYAKAR